jgi:NAD(P)-dependent dehydrogenase (short-subunit alcohol dehydrogenase family)
MTHRISGKKALITGACQGIGYEIARLFKEHGADVIISDINKPKLTSASKSIGCDSHPLDVSSEHDWERVYAYIAQTYGSLDIVCNNAGIIGFKDTFGPQDPEHISLKSWHDIHRVNLDGVFLGCKYGIKLMKYHGGSIINMSSRSGIVGLPDASAYASSKAGVRNHTKSVALYCAQKGYNIRCNSIHPAAIQTAMWDHMVHGSYDKITEQIPLKKMGTPLDVAYLALYLASDESQFMTGSEIILDGGILAGTTSSPSENY